MAEHTDSQMHACITKAKLSFLFYTIVCNPIGILLFFYLHTSYLSSVSSAKTRPLNLNGGIWWLCELQRQGAKVNRKNRGEVKMRGPQNDTIKKQLKESGLKGAGVSTTVTAVWRSHNRQECRTDRADSGSYMAAKDQAQCTTAA